MVSSKHGLKDQLVGKLKSAEGQLTHDRLRQAQGKAQETYGKLKKHLNKQEQNNKGDH